MAKRNFLAFPCLNLLGCLFQGFSQPVKIRLLLLLNGIWDSPRCESPSARNSSFAVVFEETGGCWPLSKAQICPMATWRDEDNQGLLHFKYLLTSSETILCLLSFPPVPFHPPVGVPWTCPWTRSWQLTLGPSEMAQQGPKGLCFSPTTVSSLPFSRIRMRQIPSGWFNPEYLILQEFAGTHISVIAR